jgi:hypothetical protein
MSRQIDPAQILITQIAETCFDRCIKSTNSSKLDKNDSHCVIQCTSSILQTKSFILSRLMPEPEEMDEDQEMDEGKEKVNE